MNVDLAIEKLREAMAVLSSYESAVGAEGPTMEELEACWEDGKPFDDDASYDAMQHCWLMMHEAMEQLKEER
jgi:hypothetical protein